MDHRGTERETRLLGKSISTDKNTDVSLNISRSYTQGQKVSFLGRETTVRSSVSLRMSGAYSRRNGETVQVVNGVRRPAQFPVEEDRLSVNAGGSYGFSDNVTGNVDLGFGQNRDLQRDIVRRNVRVEVRRSSRSDGASRASHSLPDAARAALAIGAWASEFRSTGRERTHASCTGLARPRIPGSPGHRAFLDWLAPELTGSVGASSSRASSTRWPPPLPLTNVIARFGPSAGGGSRCAPLRHARMDDQIRTRHGATIRCPAPTTGLGVACCSRSPSDGGPPPSIGVDLVFFDGEDQGRATVGAEFCRGSRGYAARLGPDGGRGIRVRSGRRSRPQHPSRAVLERAGPSLVGWCSRRRVRRRRRFRYDSEAPRLRRTTCRSSKPPPGCRRDRFRLRRLAHTS